MRIAIGDIQTFSTPTDLLSYCATNPDQEAGYAPQGQSPAQTLACQQWPYVLPPSQIVVNSVATTTTPTDLTTLLTSSAIGGIPNWFLIVGILGLGYFLMKGSR